MATNPDFRDLFAAFCDEGVEFLLVGAHAVMHFTVPRYTKDLDLWVRPTHDNAERAYRALARFGAPLDDLSVEDLSRDGTIFQIGVPPNRIDVLTSLDGLSFDDAWPRRAASSYGGVAISLLCLDDLIKNKETVGRPQDLLDLEWLKKLRR